MAKTTPCVRDRMLIYDDGEQKRTILVDSQDWWCWLAAPGTASFRFERKLASATLTGKTFNFTARREQKGAARYWYAYRKLHGRLRKTYLGRAEELTWERMKQAAQTLACGEIEQTEVGYAGRVSEEQPAYVNMETKMPLLARSYIPQALHESYMRRLPAVFSLGVPAQEHSEMLLSEREHDVLQLLAAGRSNQEIASDLVIALSTVKTHLNNLYLKLGVHSRTQAIMRAKELGLL